MAIARYSSIIIQLIIMAVLARLLNPSDFGVVAIAMVFIVFFSLLSDFGLAPAIIQFRHLNDADLRALFGFTFWAGLLLALLFYAFSPLIAHMYGTEILKKICRLLSFQIFFNTLNIVPNTLLLRDKKFHVIAYRNILIQIGCGVVASWAAYKGAGVYALLIAPVLGAFLNVAINIGYMRLGITFFPSVAPLRIIYKFSSYQFLFNFVNYFGRNLDKLLIGKILDVAALGYYDKSYRLMLMPVENINSVLSPVLHPYLSDFQNEPQKIYQIYQRITGLLLNLSFPIAAMLLFTGKEWILLIFGAQWSGAVSSFCILSVSVATQIPSVTTGAVLQACNQTRLLFLLGMLNVGVAVAGLLIGALVFRTIEAVSVAFVLTAALSAGNSFYAVYHYCFRVRFGSFVRLLAGPAGCYLFQLLVLYFLSRSLWPVGLIEALSIKLLVWTLLTFLYFQYLTPYRPTFYLQKFFRGRLRN